jgi:hypothetical protein
VVCIIATNVAPPELLWRPNRRTRFGVGAVGLLQLYCSDAMAPEPMHAAHVANVLFDQSKIVSRDLHRQTDSLTGQVFVQDRFLSRDRGLDRLGQRAAPSCQLASTMTRIASRIRPGGHGLSFVFEIKVMGPARQEENRVIFSTC